MTKIQYALVLCALMQAHAVPVEPNSSESISSDSDESHNKPRHYYNNGHQGSPYENPRGLYQPKTKRNAPDQHPIGTQPASNPQEFPRTAVESNQHRQTGQSGEQRAPGLLLALNPSSTGTSTTVASALSDHRAYQNREIRGNNDEETQSKLLGTGGGTGEVPSTVSTVSSTVVPGYLYGEHLQEAESRPTTSKIE